MHLEWLIDAFKYWAAAPEEGYSLATREQSEPVRAELVEHKIA